VFEVGVVLNNVLVFLHIVAHLVVFFSVSLIRALFIVQIQIQIIIFYIQSGFFFVLEHENIR